MKKLIALYVVAFALVFGIASPASAQHCDVKKGDSVYRIAKRYHIVFKRLLEYNQNLKNPDLIYPDDEIQIPDDSDGNTSTEGSENDNVESGNDELTGQGESTQANEVLKLVNAERSKQGLKALTLSSTLTSVANVKAKDMAVHKYFSHNSPTYGTPFEMLQKFGVKYKTAGENIAGGQKTPAQVMQTWMNSSGHKANILSSKYTELGVGYYAGGSYGTYWVQLFVGK